VTAGDVSAPPGGGRILVVKHGALGDFVQATGAFAAIRRHHSAARITLLTTAPLTALAAAGGWFDDIWVDERPSPWRLRAWIALVRRIRDAGFARIYDLQTSRRSSLYFQGLRAMTGGRLPEWSGIAAGCSHPHADPGRDALHTLDRLADQLREAGVDAVPPPDLSAVQADLGRFALEARSPRVLVVPGGSAHRPAKRWPAARFADFAGRLAERGMTPILIGGAADRQVLDAVAAVVPAARDLGGATSLTEIVELARSAVAAVGNDTGPMHLAAAGGCPSVVLFSSESDPDLCAPRDPGGRSVAILRSPRLADLPVAEVMAAFEAVVQTRPGGSGVLDRKAAC
jgi:ADP-heptose:LPS heptosyltransferase